MVSENKIQLKRIGKPPQQSSQKKSLVEQVSVKALKYKIQRNTCACFSKAKNETGKERDAIKNALQVITSELHLVCNILDRLYEK